VRPSSPRWRGEEEAPCEVRSQRVEQLLLRAPRQPQAQRRVHVERQVDLARLDAREFSFEARRVDARPHRDRGSNRAQDEEQCRRVPRERQTAREGDETEGDANEQQGNREMDDLWMIRGEVGHVVGRGDAKLATIFLL